MLLKLISCFWGFVYIFFISLFSRNKFVISLLRSRIELGLRIRITNNGRLHCKGLTTRGNVSLLVDQGLLEIADGVFINAGSSINCLQSVKIGSNTLLGQNVQIFDHDHFYQAGVHKNQFVKSSVSIGKRCWIGANAVILKGVHIADDVVVGAGTIVTKDIESSGIYVSIKPAIVKIK